MKIILFCTSRPVSVLAAAAGVLVFGTAAFFRLGVELLPGLKIPLVRVAASFPGMTAEDVEDLVTRPLENALSSVKGLRGMESVTKEEISLIALRFDWTGDFRTAAAEVREKVDAAYPYLPYGIDRPVVVTEDLNARPVLVLAVSPAPGRSLREAGDLAKREIASALQRVPGVSYVGISGAVGTEILVEADADRLLAARMSVRELADLIAGAAADRPAGRIVEGGREHPVLASSGIDSAEKLRKLPLPAGGAGTAFTLGDAASVSESPREESSFFLADGKQCVGLRVGKTPEAGSREVARAVLAELPRLRERFGREVGFAVAADESREIDAALRGLPAAAMIGIASVFLVLAGLFGGPEIPLIVSSSVPLCCAATFLFMHFAGMSLNVVSLSGITLGIGMIVDNGIIVLEGLSRSGRTDPREAARRAAETASAVFPSTATTMLVFLPIAFIPGIIGALFADLAAVLSFLLAVSFLFSLTLTPALFVLFRPAAGKVPRRPLCGIGGIYAKYLFAAFRRPRLPLLVFVVLAAAGTAAFLRLPAGVTPERDPGRLELTAAFPPGTGIAETLAESRELSRRILRVPGAAGVFAEAGPDGDSPADRGMAGRNSWTVRFTVTVAGRASGETGRDIAEAAAKTAAIRSGPAVPEDATSRLLGARKGFSFRLSGGGRDELLRRAGDLVRRTGERGLAAGVFLDTEKTLPRIDFRLDPAAAAFHRIPAEEALDTLQTSVRGRIAAAFRRDDRELPVRVRLREERRQNDPDLSAIPLPAGEGFIRAGEAGTFTKGFSCPELHRTDRRNSVTVTFTPAPGMERDLERTLADEPGGELLSRSGFAAEAKSAGSVFALAVVLMYLLLGAQFESPLVPLLLLLSFPLSAAGSFLLLLAFGYSLNVNSFLGILILLGTTINSPILLTGAYGDGGTLRIVRESVLRLRPLAATVATTLTALLPVLLHRSGENVLQSNTAAALAGGLAAGTAAVLLVYPPLYLFAVRSGRRKR